MAIIIKIPFLHYSKQFKHLFESEFWVEIVL